MKIRVAFYKYNKKFFNAGISAWTWLPNMFTPAYSHVELGVKPAKDWKYFSSTLRDGAKGTRWIPPAKLFKHKDRWDVYEIDVDASVDDIMDRANNILDLPYDFAGLTGFVAPFGFSNKKSKWYCSEACYKVLTGVWKKIISPRRFYSYIKKFFKKSIKKVMI